MCVDAKKLKAIIEGAEPFFKTMFEVALNYGFTLMDCPAWSYVRSSERALLELSMELSKVVVAEKWTFILPPGKKFTVILNVTYSLEDCDDVEKCLEYGFTKPLTYKVVAVMEETE